MLFRRRWKCPPIAHWALAIVGGAVVWASAALAEAGPEGRLADLAVEAGQHAFRVSNLSPVEVAAGVVWQLEVDGAKGRSRIEGSLPAIGPFHSTDIWPPGVVVSPGARLTLCTNAERDPLEVEYGNNCATLSVREVKLDLALSHVRVDRGTVRFRVSNRADVPSPPFEVRVSTHAGERLAGTQTRMLNDLDPRSTRDESFRLDLWAHSNPDLLAGLAASCCVTTLEIDPRHRLEDVARENNRVQVTHGLD